MANLRPVEFKLVEKLTEMESGYVLDFSNQTFAEFFSDEAGIDIYDDAFSEYGGSKGKRLRAFLRRAQPLAVARILTSLWEYREIRRLERGEPETIQNCRARLSAIVERLGGDPLPAHDISQVDTARPVSAPSSIRKGPSVVDRQALQDEFQAMFDMAPHPRGYAFEKFLKKLFDAWGLDSRGGFRNSGEQIDGSFVHDQNTYLLEAKWHNEKTNANTLHAFQGKVEERPKWARGLLISYKGFSSDAFDAFTSRQIILMDGMDIMDTLGRELHLDEVIRAKLRHSVERKEPFARTRTLFS
ncbi:restriction endonuclease [Aliiroseovarius sp. PTFE2010]|uniref:restriction endonuclease n=1 Tax=Aliiroseovarius sp. PTFE2010 TaxID=3417190 RepID=UPI003CE71CED